MEDYKEKYKQALERAKNYHKGHTLDVNPQAAMEYVFPELKESDDERIRKEILQSIKNNMIVIHKDKCIDWLEKQGEQELNSVFDIKIPFGAKDSELQEVSYCIPEGFYAEIDKNKVVIKKVEQKFDSNCLLSWSEKDEIMLNNVISILEPISLTTYSCYAINSMTNWLKSLKERMKGD